MELCFLRQFANFYSASLAVVARLPYVPRLKSDDFLCKSNLGLTNDPSLIHSGDTLDVAIWSTVEQGLAITAGSLATLRPLFTLILCRLGLATQTTNPKPTRSGSQILGSHRRPSRNELDMYNLSAIAEQGDVKSHFEPSDLPKSPNWYQTGFDKVRRVSFAPKKKKEADKADNTSEKSLRDSGSASLRSLRDDTAMQIMVSRSFVVTDAERNSWAEKPPR